LDHPDGASGGCGQQSEKGRDPEKRPLIHFSYLHGMEKEHHYSVSMVWTGNRGEGTKNYRAFSRDHIVQVSGKADIAGSSDPSFRGSPDRYNPEELLVSSISACHMLWYLHLCSVNNIIVTGYRDQAKGIMLEGDDGGGRFKEVGRNPLITLTEAAMIGRATELHEEAHRLCFIANSVNFPVKHKPVFEVR
jgi:organic hydroperoxide reductase OsmC/OhrA